MPHLITELSTTIDIKPKPELVQTTTPLGLQHYLNYKYLIYIYIVIYSYWSMYSLL